ncbi:MAG: trypsin-like peptidase domain-containing protein [Dokdonia sp.]
MMKKFTSLLVVALLAGAITLGAYTLFIEHNAPQKIVETTAIPAPVYTPTSYSASTAAASGVDFTEAAEKSLHGVVHVKNVQEYRRPRNMMEYFRGGGLQGKGIVGAGSGVIISADGYIITNNHVIDGAIEVEVTLNDNRKFTADVVGSDVTADIALLKIESDDTLPYITFGDSDAAKVGEWVLAVGNPFNLTSTVTAGIISAKARDIDETDLNVQSFIQTDAAINPGNSGGALVNTNGELIGINTAITSQTGSYVGYAFAVPSNNARKIVNDIMEYGAVQKGILGVQGGSLTPELTEKLDLPTSEGVYISGVELGSGADKAGVQRGDIITMVDNIQVNKFSDLTGYVNTKRPNDVVQVSILRDKDQIVLPVTLVKPTAFKLDRLGIEVKNATDRDLEVFNADSGVVISNLINPEMRRYNNLIGAIIAEIDDEEVKNVTDVERIMNSKSSNEPISIVVYDRSGERNRFIFKD